ncbi:DNA helicase MCM8-like isoform X2 [Neodiprion lecontei]|uniref:DNA helicase MCM8 n=1 Tax=Neodiprion lecontei TaxID=441921 RepID=A0ABM3FKW6_NEOLC|nr:DNA helicase MCM8-like isoform X2 [Neodiprion lecontei]
MNNRGRSWYRNKGKRKRPSEITETLGGSKKDMSNPTDSSEACSLFNPNRHNSPYHNWDLYFHNEVYTKASSTVRKIEAMQRFIMSHMDIFPVSNLENNKPYNVDIKILLKDDLFYNEWSSFKEDLTNDPKHTLNCLGMAIDQMMIETITAKEGMDDVTVSANLPIAVVRISNYGPVLSLRDLKVNSYGKLISIRGCIMRVGNIKHFAQWMEFLCVSCGSRMISRQVDGIYTLPTKCVSCNGKKFQPLLSSDDKGRMPRIIDVDLIEDLVNTCMPGDDITVTGIIKVRGNEKNSSKGNTAANLFSLYMEAVYILNNKSQNKCAVALDLTDVDHLAVKVNCQLREIVKLTRTSEFLIGFSILLQEVYHDPNVFKLLVQSLCPSIYGHELIKAGLILSLFGGSTKSQDVRDDVHVLVVGDPGLGKSQMLQACARVAAKGIYVCGTSSTSTGLTVTLVKDASTGDVVLEPGALVLADKGTCCIDEFDKMSTQHQALLEAMEQQSVSVAKSGMVCCLPARTSILAAANPARGRYDRSKTVIENLNMKQPLLSRFDLIFILLDQPDAHLDDLLSDHVMAVHVGISNQIGDMRSNSTNSLSTGESSTSANNLRQKLSLCPTETIDPIPHRILRNYIIYARQYVKPKITPAAVEVLKGFYLKCRARNDREKITPMTPRQLAALIRLTEARAKLELREEATHSDALEVIEIIKFSMAEVDVEHIEPDYSLLSGSGKLTAAKVKAFISLLRDKAAAMEKTVFSTREMRDLATKEKIIVDDFNALISKLNENGFILKKGPNLYSVTTNN